MAGTLTPSKSFAGISPTAGAKTSATTTAKTGSAWSQLYSPEAVGLYASILGNVAKSSKDSRQQEASSALDMADARRRAELDAYEAQLGDYNAGLSYKMNITPEAVKRLQFMDVRDNYNPLDRLKSLRGISTLEDLDAFRKAPAYTPTYTRSEDYTKAADEYKRQMLDMVLNPTARPALPSADSYLASRQTANDKATKTPGWESALSAAGAAGNLYANVLAPKTKTSALSSYIAPSKGRLAYVDEDGTIREIPSTGGSDIASRLRGRMQT
jgi:hypothetical protein